ISQHVGLIADYYYQKVRNELHNNTDEPSCPSRGILVKSIQIILLRNQNCKDTISKNLVGPDLDNTEKHLVETIQRECNGRPKCDLRETWKIKPTFNCNGSLVPADRIRITGECVETQVDNKSVFDFYLITKLTLPKKAIFISGNRKLNKRCQLTGNYSQIDITLLHLEFSTTQSENKTDFFSITDSGRDIHLYYQSQNVTANTGESFRLENAILEVNLNNGFVWMKIEANDGGNVSCMESDLDWHIPSVIDGLNIEDTSILVKTIKIISAVWIVSISSCVALSLVILIRKRGNKTRTSISNVTSTQSDNHVYNVTSPQHDNHVYTEAIVNQRDIHIYTNASTNRRENNVYDLTVTEQRDNHIYNSGIIIPPELRIYSEILQTDSSESEHLEVLDLDVEPHYIFIK
ncbi:hypothetical protein BgiBS90_026237, partial [Biomphalaria glabrata]